MLPLHTIPVLFTSTFISLFASPPSLGQVSAENVQRLLASDGSGGSGDIFNPPAGDNFGWSVSVAGNTAVVGAWLHNPFGILHAGAAYVFYREDTQWVEQAKLVANDAAAFDLFGESCDCSGETIVVGAIGHDPGGSAYVFVRQGTQWIQQARIDGNQTFGDAVAVDRDTFVAGAPANETAHVYVRHGTAWSEQGTFAPQDLTRSSHFGKSVAISGDYIVVGAWGDDAIGDNSGSVYVFSREGTSWNQMAKLTADDAAPGGSFGSAVCIDNDVLAVGAPTDDQVAPEGGAVYVFRRTDSGWFQEQKLVASDVAQMPVLGRSVSLCGDLLVAGATAARKIYVFKYDGTTWREVAQLQTFDQPFPEADLFGSSVATDGNRVLAGAPLDDPLGEDSGAAYLYAVRRRVGTAACFGTNCPCGNTDNTAGCTNSTGSGGLLIGTGSRSVSCENSLEFTASQLPHPTSGLLYMGDTAIATPLLDGIQCAGGTTYRLTGLMQTADGAGAITFGPGVLGASGDLIDPGETWHFQAFYRDAVGSPCGAGANLTNAYSVTFLP